MPGATPTPTPTPGGRFAHRRLLRRTFWPFWLGVGLILFSLTTNWSAESTYFYTRNCYSWEWGCSSYGTTSDSQIFGGFGSGVWTPLLLGAVVGVIAWGSGRLDAKRPTWLERVPSIAVAVLIVVSLVHVPGALAFESWFEDPIPGVVPTYEPGPGPFLTLLGVWPLRRGIRRVRTAYGGGAAATGGATTAATGASTAPSTKAPSSPAAPST